jgi:hypothetical protein
MSAIDSLTFFHWNKPRLLIDIRPDRIFLKGSFTGARSIPAEKHNALQELSVKIQRLANNDPVHIIDQDGKIAADLSRHIAVKYLEGGYDAFKEFREKAFARGPALCLLGGYTGSGKTALLQELKLRGHSSIDLELLAAHRGSVFGHISSDAPVTHEDFQNKLLSCWLALNPETPVWIEEKGPFLGKAGLPPALYRAMLNSPLLHLDVPFDQRLIRVQQVYGQMEKDTFRVGIRSLEDRMGMRYNHKALHYYDTGQTERCFELLLNYYDKAYDRRRRDHWLHTTIHIPHRHENIGATIGELEAFIKRNPAVHTAGNPIPKN